MTIVIIVCISDTSSHFCYLGVGNHDMTMSKPILVSPNVLNNTQSVSFMFHGAIHLSMSNSDETHNVNEELWTKWCFDWPQEASSFTLIALSSDVGIRNIEEHSKNCKEQIIRKLVSLDLVHIMAIKLQC